MDTTGSSVIAAFAHIREAQQAYNEITAAGFPAQEVKLVANDQDPELDNNRTDSTWSRTYPLASEPKSGIIHFFASLFGFESESTSATNARTHANQDLHHESQQYFSEQYQRGSHLLVVYTRSQREEAIQILERCGGHIENQASLLYERELAKTRAPLIETEIRTIDVEAREKPLEQRRQTPAHDGQPSPGPLA